jgi:hypothetical protein
MARYLRISVFSLLLLMPLGCSKKSLPIAPVSGRVTMDGKPLAHALVRFQPEKRDKDPNVSPDAYGETDEQGNYSLKPVLSDRDDVDGAVVGLNYVQLSVYDRGDGKRQPRETLPAKYSTDSKLTFEVPPGGTTSANFDLKSK